MKRRQTEWDMCGGRARLGDVAWRDGKVEEARQILVDAIYNFHADQNRNGLSFALDEIANLYVVIDKPKIAAQLIGWSDANRRNFGDPRPCIEQADLYRSIASIKAKIGPSAYDTTYNAGQRLTLDEIMAIATGNKLSPLICMGLVF